MPSRPVMNESVRRDDSDQYQVAPATVVGLQLYSDWAWRACLYSSSVSKCRYERGNTSKLNQLTASQPTQSQPTDREPINSEPTYRQRAIRPACPPFTCVTSMLRQLRSNRLIGPCSPDVWPTLVPWVAHGENASITNPPAGLTTLERRVVWILFWSIPRLCPCFMHSGQWALGMLRCIRASWLIWGVESPSEPR